MSDAPVDRDGTAGVWKTTETVGEVALAVGDDAGKGPVAKPLIIIGVAVVVFVLSFLLTFLIPGASDTPNAGPHHDVGRSLGLAAVGTIVICGFILSTQRRR